MSVNDVAKAIVAAGTVSDKKPTGYDTPATVKRVEDGVAYVHIPGGVDETPVKLTVNASAGDSVQVRVSEGRAFIVGNASAPPTDDATAKKAQSTADTALSDAQNARTAAAIAEESAQIASAAAAQAKETTDEINAYAETADKTVTQILHDGETAGTAAQEAKASAENASEYAARALGNLSSVQSVTETLNWITSHGTMTLTSDTELDPTHVYFVQDNNGDYVVGGTHYAVVTEPDIADISTYYELSIDESLNNYVATHLAVDTEGLWLIPDSDGNKVLIATGAGSTYTSAGTYIIGKVNSADTVLASFTKNGAQIGQASETHVMVEQNNLSLYKGNDVTPYFRVQYLIDSDGYITERARVAGTDQAFISFATNTNSIQSVTVNGAAVSYRLVQGYGKDIRFTSTLSSDDIVVVKYMPLSTGAQDNAIAFTFGKRTSSNYGAMSVSIGNENRVEAFEGVAIGSHNFVNPNFLYSIALGTGLSTLDSYQIVVGKYNEADSGAFIIGNGTSDSNCSNALTVDWSGNSDQQGRATTQDMSASDVADFIDALDMSGQYHVVGQVYQFGWNKTSASGSGTAITGSATLPAGTYIIVVQVPVISALTVMQIQGISGKYIAGSHNYETCVMIHTFTSDTEIQLQLAQAASVTFSAIDRGGMKAIRIA